MSLERVRVGDVLRLERRPVAVEPLGEYSEIGVRSFGRGIFHKEPITGSELGTKRVFHIEPGDLIFSNVFSWEGAVALAGDSEKGLVGSHRFMTYVPRDDRILPAWAAWFFVSEPGLELLGAASPGSAGRNRTLAMERFENLEIPLPPPDEQARTASRLDALARSMVDLRLLSSRAAALSDAWAASLCNRSDLSSGDKSARGWRRVNLGSILAPSVDRVRVQPEAEYPNIGILSFGRGVFAKPPIEGSGTSAATLNRIRGGQFIYSRLFAFEGAYAYVPDEFDGCFVSNEFPTFDIDPDQGDARWLAAYLRSPSRWAELGGSSKGLGVRRQRVPVEALLEYEVWLPPLPVQKRAVATLADFGGAEDRRIEITERFDSLLPAALNDAFGRVS